MRPDVSVRGALYGFLLFFQQRSAVFPCFSANAFRLTAVTEIAPSALMLAGAVAAAVFVLRLRLIAVGRGTPRKAAGINVLRTVETAARYIVHGTGHRIGLPAFSLIAGFAAEGFLFKAPVIKGGCRPWVYFPYERAWRPAWDWPLRPAPQGRLPRPSPSRPQVLA